MRGIDRDLIRGGHYGQRSRELGRNISRDLIAALRGAELIATGPRRPKPGAPAFSTRTKTAKATKNTQASDCSRSKRFSACAVRPLRRGRNEAEHKARGSTPKTESVSSQF
jgi:hypothetical protein